MNEPPVCEKCGDEYWLGEGCEVSKYCDPCAQERVAEVEAENAELRAKLSEREQWISPDFRKQLWLTHGCGIACLYGDDGEMQCGRFRPFIDFKRDSEEVILNGIAAHCLSRLKESLSAPPAPDERGIS